MKMRWTSLIFFIFFTASSVAAQEFKDITADELKKMIDGKEKMVLVDARGEMDYKQGHIPTAINIPPEKFLMIQELLPEDKDAFLVFYCRDGTG